MRSRIFAVLAIAIFAGGGLAYGTYNFMQNQPVKTVSTPTQPVVVAAADLQLGAEVKKEDLTVVNFPAGQAPRGLLLEAFRRHRPWPDRAAREERADPRRQAGVEGSGLGLPPVIPEGMRAVSVRVNEVIGVAGYVLPGTRVDVVATASPTMDKTDTTSKLVLSNVQVLTAGTRMEQDSEKGKPIQVTVVTLLVTPEQSSGSRSPAPKARFSSRCATRSIRARRPRPASRRQHSSARPRPPLRSVRSRRPRGQGQPAGHADRARAPCRRRPSRLSAATSAPGSRQVMSHLRFPASTTEAEAGLATGIETCHSEDHK